MTSDIIKTSKIINEFLIMVNIFILFPFELEIYRQNKFSKLSWLTLDFFVNRDTFGEEIA